VPGLPPPVVPPEAYDEDYYLSACLGHEEWARSQGAEAAGIYAGVLELAGLAAGEVLVDLGTGRGELPALAARRGAVRAVGVEYSPAAVALARRTIAAQGAGDRAEVIAADVRAVPLPDGMADLVTLVDVVEHLAPGELEAALGEARRLLRPGGRLLVHTMPNRTIYAVTYRLQRLSRPGRRARWPADPRNEHERRMHVNEQTAGALRRALRRAGFEGVRVRPGRWVHDQFVPEASARPLYHRLAAHHATARLGAADLWASARRP
jgi:ubiquinone/menaquinone biosynthesis C-methylase UbiE